MSRELGLRTSEEQIKDEFDEMFRGFKDPEIKARKMLERNREERVKNKKAKYGYS